VRIEEVVGRAPDLIIGSWCGKKFRPERVAARPGFLDRAVDETAEIPDGHRWDAPPKVEFASDSPLEGDSAHSRQIHQIIQQDAKAASDPTHFGTHPEGPVSGARWRTTADENTAASTDGRVG
jgi:hypothetical protein